MRRCLGLEGLGEVLECAASCERAREGIWVPREGDCQAL